MTDNNKHPIKLAIVAMGGQGGGVLSSWLVALAENNQHYAQYTSVPGVAQRTGSTVYYLELFPEDLAKQAGKEPVMALMPVEGDVDIVVAGELVEAGRALIRGIVTPEQTTLIASTHRLYSQSEKESLGDGRADSKLIVEAAREHARRFIGFDMNQAAIETDCMISAVLFGALAGCGQLPFERSQFEEVIKQGGKAVESNLAGFNIGYRYANEQRHKGLPEESSIETTQAPFSFPKSKNQDVQNLLSKVQSGLPEQAHEFTVEGIKRLLDYQDLAYATEYVHRVFNINEIDVAYGGQQHEFELSREVARHLALWMSYEDTARVADLKIRQQRFARYKEHANTGPGDVAHVVEFMHPRVEEIADTMPAWLGQIILGVAPIRSLVGLFCKQRTVNTSRLGGFLLLYLTAKFRAIRRSSLRFKREHQRISEWLELIGSTANADYHSAVAIARCQRLIKGYGDTHERGWQSYSSIVTSLPIILAAKEPGKTIERLRDAALAEESGAQLAHELNATKV